MWTALQSLGTGLLALGAAWFGWFLQRRDKADAKTEKRLDVRREKAEEIYELLQTCMDQSKSAVFRAIEESHGTAKYERPTDAMPSLDRLKALVTMYFPAARSIIDELASQLMQPVKRHSDVINELIDNTATIEVDEQLKRMRGSQLQLARETAAATVQTMMTLRGFMDRTVESLV